MRLDVYLHDERVASLRRRGKGYSEEPREVSSLAWLGQGELEELRKLDEGLPEVSEGAASEGWHGPVIDRIHEAVSRRVGFLWEEVQG